MIRIGQIGIGHNHGEAKMWTVRKFPELFEVVGFAEDDPEWLRKRGDLPAYRGLRRMPADELLEKCDAVLVETDVPDLTATALRCVEAGRHVHVDKPASGTLAEWKAVLDIARAKDLVVQLGYMYRYNPAVRRCMEMIREGALGEIRSVNAEMSTLHPKEYRQWLAGFFGGVMYILGAHLVDLTVSILGKPGRVTSFLRRTGADGIDLPDNTLAVLEYENALARIFVSSVEVNGFGRRQLVVSGTRGTVAICPLERPITMTYSDLSIADAPYEDRKIVIPFEDHTADGRYDEMMKDFCAFVEGRKQNPFTYAHEYEVQQVLDEIVGGVRFLGDRGAPRGEERSR